jgi:magnesium chelatase subunit I
MIPSIIGKVELVYEGEQEGAAFVAERLIGSASKTLFDMYFPAIKKLKHEDDKDVYDDVLQWFFEQSAFELMDDGSEKEYSEALNSITALDKLVTTYMPQAEDEDKLFIKEFVLWALVEYKKLNKKRIVKGFEFKDSYGAYLSNL